MTWTPPSGTTYIFPWENNEAGGTPLDAANLDEMQQNMEGFVLAAVNSLASYVDTSIAAALGGAATPTNTGAPVISGTLTVGSELTIETAATWTEAGEPITPTSIAYQWQLGSSAGGTFAAESTNGTGNTYVLQSADATKYLRVAETPTFLINGASVQGATVYSNVLGPIVAQGAAALSTLVEPFNESTLPAAWESAGTVTIGGGAATLSVDSAYSHLYTTAVYNLTGSSISTEITPPAVGNGSRQVNLELSVDQTSQSAGAFGIAWQDDNGGELVPYYTNSAGTETTLTTAASAGATSVGLKIYESAGTVYFEYSTNGTTWTPLASVAWASLGFAITALYVDFVAGYYGTETTSIAEIANVNTAFTIGGGSGGGSLVAVNNAAVPMSGSAVLNSGSPTMNTTTADNCTGGFIIVQGTETALAQQAKAANPACKVLMYKDSSEAQNASSTLADVDSGVTYSQASSEGWLLEDEGSPILLNGYSGQYATDIGNTAYQSAWAENVIGLLGTPGSPWDGVFCDDINTSISDLTGTAYASGTSYATAMGEWCEAVGPAIAAAGFIVIGNFGEWWLNEATMNPWLAYLDGAMMEQWMGFGQDPFTVSGYATTQLAVAQYAAAQGKYFYGVCQAASTDTASQTFCTAAMLIASPGSSFSLAYSDGGDYDVGEWPAIYTTAKTLGEATGAATSSGSTYTREFANGSVTCNFSTGVGTITT